MGLPINVIFSTLYFEGMIAPINNMPATSAKKRKTKIIGERCGIMRVI